MKLSLVIVTKNRPESVKRLLESLLSQSVLSFETIIVNDGGDETSLNKITSLPKFVGLLIKVVTNVESVGSGKARNQGVESSKNEILLLLDDDVEIVSKTFLEAGVNFFNDDQVGLVFPRKTDVSGKKTEDLSYFKESSSGELHGCSLEEALKIQLAGEIVYGPMVSFVRRNAFKDVLGYDSIYGYGIGHSFREESDFQNRIQKKGWRVKLASEIFFNHHIQNQGGHGSNTFKKLFWIAHNQIIFSSRHEKNFLIKQALFTAWDLPRYAKGSGNICSYSAGLLGVGAGFVSSALSTIKSKLRQS
jgi:glycosyltransferase involved in cell wall biosynthesis